MPFVYTQYICFHNISISMNDWITTVVCRSYIDIWCTFCPCLGNIWILFTNFYMTTCILIIEMLFANSIFLTCWTKSLPEGLFDNFTYQCNVHVCTVYSLPRSPHLSVLYLFSYIELNLPNFRAYNILNLDFNTPL